MSVVLFIIKAIHENPLLCFFINVHVCYIYIVHPPFKEHKRTNKHDEHRHSTKQSHHHHRRKHIDNVVSKNSKQHYQENEMSSNECVVNMEKLIDTKSSFHLHTDSDGESERMPVKPWSPTPHHLNGSSSLQFSNNNDNQESSSPQLTLALRSLFEMITEDLDKFVYTPAPNGLGDIQCRITRDKRGMEKGLFPTYYMHVERPGDGKKVCEEEGELCGIRNLFDLVFYSCWTKTST